MKMVCKLLLVIAVAAVILDQTAGQVFQVGQDMYQIMPNDDCQDSALKKTIATIKESFGHLGQMAHKSTWDALSFITDCAFNFRCRLGKSMTLLKNAVDLVSILPSHSMKLGANLTNCLIRRYYNDAGNHNCDWNMCLHSCSYNC